jgi:hypothetical protein
LEYLEVSDLDQSIPGFQLFSTDKERAAVMEMRKKLDLEIKQELKNFKDNVPLYRREMEGEITRKAKDDNYVSYILDNTGEDYNPENKYLPSLAGHTTREREKHVADHVAQKLKDAVAKRDTGENVFGDLSQNEKLEGAFNFTAAQYKKLQDLHVDNLISGDKEDDIRAVEKTLPTMLAGKMIENASAHAVDAKATALVRFGVALTNTKDLVRKELYGRQILDSQPKMGPHTEAFEADASKIFDDLQLKLDKTKVQAFAKLPKNVRKQDRISIIEEVKPIEERHKNDKKSSVWGKTVVDDYQVTRAQVIYQRRFDNYVAEVHAVAMVGSDDDHTQGINGVLQGRMGHKLFEEKAQSAIAQLVELDTPDNPDFKYREADRTLMKQDAKAETEYLFQEFNNMDRKALEKVDKAYQVPAAEVSRLINRPDVKLSKPSTLDNEPLKGMVSGLQDLYNADFKQYREDVNNMALRSVIDTLDVVTTPNDLEQDVKNNADFALSDLKYKFSILPITPVRSNTLYGSGDRLISDSTREANFVLTAVGVRKGFSSEAPWTYNSEKLGHIVKFATKREQDALETPENVALNPEADEPVVNPNNQDFGIPVPVNVINPVVDRRAVGHPDGFPPTPALGVGAVQLPRYSSDSPPATPDAVMLADDPNASMAENLESGIAEHSPSTPELQDTVDPEIEAIKDSQPATPPPAALDDQPISEDFGLPASRQAEVFEASPSSAVRRAQSAKDSNREGDGR